MLQFSANVTNEIGSGRSKALICVHIIDNLNDIKYAATTYYNNVTLSNGVTYLADDTLVSVEPPQFNTSVDREQYKITVAGSDFLDLIGTEGDLVGCRLFVYLVFINSVTGTPFLDMVDALPFYIGRVDGISGELETGEIGSELYIIKGASPMMALEMSKGLFLSRDFVRGRYPGDTSCDTIYEGSGSLVLKWGRS